MDIYTDGGKFLGRVQEILLDLEKGEIIRLTMEPLNSFTSRSSLLRMWWLLQRAPPQQQALMSNFVFNFPFFLPLLFHFSQPVVLPLTTYPWSSGNKEGWFCVFIR